MVVVHRETVGSPAGVVLAAFGETAESTNAPLGFQEGVVFIQRDSVAAFELSLAPRQLVSLLPVITDLRLAIQGDAPFVFLGHAADGLNEHTAYFLRDRGANSDLDFIVNPA